MFVDMILPHITRITLQGNTASYEIEPLELGSQILLRSYEDGAISMTQGVQRERNRYLDYQFCCQWYRCQCMQQSPYSFEKKEYWRSAKGGTRLEEDHQCCYNAYKEQIVATRFSRGQGHGRTLHDR